MDPSAQAVCLFIALVCFIVAAIVAWIIQPRAVYSTLIAVGLAAWVLVAFWNAVEAA